jgi:protein ImuB
VTRSGAGAARNTAVAERAEPGGDARHRAGQRSRTLVLWCPDWPAVAAARQAGRPASDPVAVFRANRVQACTAAARAEGVHVGQRRRDAQSRCPDLLITQVDPDRDGRLFEPVAAAVESLAPGVEILRPGVVACPARGPSRYFGSDIAAAEKIVDIVEALDVECSVGVADVLAVAVLAAHRAVIVPPGGAAAFCAALPIGELARDPAICPPERAALIDLLIRLGITTAGAFAALPEHKVATRFGADGLQAHRLANGRGERGLSRRQIPEELTVVQVCDPPLERVDTAAFAARALAERFHARLADAGLACTRLAITAVTERDATLTRVWRCAAPLTPAATADRLRWQLDGWLTAGRTVPNGPGSNRPGAAIGSPHQGGGPGAISKLILEPVEAIGAGRIQYGLWGSDGQDDQRAGWAFARVQGLLGPESVLAPILSGGRSAADRVTLVPWGDEKVSQRSPADPWPGAIPAPSPTQIPVLGAAAEAPVVTILDHAGQPVRLTDRGLLTGSPAWLIQDGDQGSGHQGSGHQGSGHQGVDAWAGPWLLDERWWAGDRRPPGARVQILTESGAALLVRVVAGGWQVEGMYD